MTWRLRRKRCCWAGPPGLYHCVNTGFCTWYELAHEVAAFMGKAKEARIIGVSVAEVPLRARSVRKFAALANEKLSRCVTMPTWREALRRYLAQGRTTASTV